MLDPTSIESYIGLAEVSFCKQQDPAKGLREGLENLLKAYQVEPHNPCVLLRISQFAALKG